MSAGTAPSRRDELEAAVAARATSTDGRHFTFQCSLHDLELQAGGYVAIGSERLGQVQSIELAWVEGAELIAAVGLDVDGPVTTRIALARGDGVVLDGARAPFHDVMLEPAPADAVAAWIDRVRPQRASLDVGELLLQPSVRFSLDAGGFDRHTFFCGQSGSGKTYALGTVLERLLVETGLRIVVLDPNSDFVRLGEVREDVDEAVGSRYAQAAAGVAVRRAFGEGPERLHVRFTDCDAEEQAAILRLDPIRDREEYGALTEALEVAGESRIAGAEAVMRQMLASDDAGLRLLGARIRNLGIHRWSLWSGSDEGALQDLVGPDGPRCLVVDLGSLETPGERAIAAESVLAALWRRRSERQPVLVVIDEAHNVCPRIPPDEVTALATEHAIRFAAEGRKFGLYLLVSTQRPQRVHELVVSQCDNLVLMRMNAAGDLSYISDVLSFAPRPLLERSTTFGLGESLVVGKVSSHPALVRFGPRLAQEGGSDVPTTWAAR